MVFGERRFHGTGTHEAAALGGGGGTVVLVLGLASAARADRAFNARFSTYATEDIAIVANTLEAVTASASSVSAGPLAGIAC